MNPSDQTKSLGDLLSHVRDDQVAKWAADAGVPAEDYLRRFPGLTDQDALVLIESEVVIRRGRGEDPELREYQARFPHLAEDLAVRFGHLSAPGSTQLADRGAQSTPSVGGDGVAPPGGPPAVPGYVLAGEIGRGGMGVVYRAQDTSLRRDVAVKVLQDRYPAEGLSARRFVEEGRITGQLQHPGIPPVHEIGVLTDGRPFLVMKLIKGETLADLLAKGGDRGRFVAVFEHVCQAVGYAHSNGVIHRDLKPGNIMVGKFGEVQVMDWGLAKVLAELDRKASGARPAEAEAPATEIRSLRDPDSATVAGSILGTPSFMPPEQAGGEVEKVDERSDVFGLGAVLCQILTGEPPYVGKDPDAVRLMAIRGQLDGAYARLDGCGADPELVALCKRCLSADPAGRPRDAGEVARAVADLREAAEERARRAERETAVAEARSEEQRRRRRWQVAAAGVAGLLLLGGVTFAWWNDRQAAERRAEDDRRDREAAARAAEQRTEDDRRAQAERDRLARNGEAVAALLDRCEEALRDDDARRAAISLELAERRVSEGGADGLRPRLDRCRADYDLLRELDRVADLVTTWRDGDFQEPRALAAMPGVLARLRIVLGQTPPAEAARLINASLVRDRLLTAVDWWFSLASQPAIMRSLLGSLPRSLPSFRYNPPPEHDRAAALGPSLRALLHEADPDPYRDAFRAALAEANTDRIRELAERAEVLQQPPRFVVVIGRCVAVPVPRSEQLLRAFLLREPGNFSVLVALADLYPMEGEGLANRIGWYRAAAAVRPMNPMVWTQLGVASVARGDLHEAVDYYRQALRVDPEYSNAHYSLGRCYARLNRTDEAIYHLRESVRLDPNDFYGHNNLGAQLLAKGDTDGAAKHFREAIRIAPTFPIAHYNLSLALARKGDVAGSSLELREALRLDPKLETISSGVERLRKETPRRPDTAPPRPEVAPPPRPVNR
jgi:predicted ribosomally synthesized peptide with SipW-like signal peptide